MPARGSFPGGQFRAMSRAKPLTVPLNISFSRMPALALRPSFVFPASWITEIVSLEITRLSTLTDFNKSYWFGTWSFVHGHGFKSSSIRPWGS